MLKNIWSKSLKYFVQIFQTKLTPNFYKPKQIVIDF